MTDTLPLWLEHGTAEDAALVRADEERALIEAGGALLARLEAERLNAMPVAKQSFRQRWLDYVI